MRWGVAAAGIMLITLPVAGADSMSSSSSGAEAATTYPPGTVLSKAFMPWICQFCDAPAPQVQSMLQHKENISGVSYEMYRLSSAGAFTSRGYENTSNDITPTAKANLILTYPMVGSGTTADIESFLDDSSKWSPFIATAVGKADYWDYDGYNLDFEPNTGGALGADYSQKYADFVDRFADALHAAGRELGVDTAFYDTDMWNYARLSATSADIFWDMNYYWSWNSFASSLDQGLAAFGTARYGLGLSGEDYTNGGQLWVANITDRIHHGETKGVRHMAWWALKVGDSDIQDANWAGVHDFVYNGSVDGSWTQTAGGGPQSLAECSGGWRVWGPASAPNTACAPDATKNPENLTLYLWNGSGVASSFVTSGWLSARREFAQPVGELRVTLWEYVDSTRLEVWMDELDAGGAVIGSRDLTGSVAGFRTQSYVFTYGGGSGVRGIVLRIVVPGASSTGYNNWFENFNITSVVSIPEVGAFFATASAGLAAIFLLAAGPGAASGNDRPRQRDDDS